MPAVTRLTDARFHSLRHDPGFAQSDAAVFRVEGMGAVDCLQGLFTCDVAAPGPGSAHYGAVLTVKGMIVADFHVLRDDVGFTLITGRAARATALELFTKHLPPRLARLTDRSELDQVIWLVGPRTPELARAAGLSWPSEPGRLGVVAPGSTTGQIARPHPLAPWAGFITAPLAECDNITSSLESAGGRRLGAMELEAARILAGWPALGLEIDSRTLPQEVRYEELGGVSYTKGCYVGQETVARVHFRGHVNRLLRGLAWEGDAPEPEEIMAESKPVGRLASALQVEQRGYGLALLRREVEPGSIVHLGGTEATVERLPFPVPAAAA